MIPQKGSSIGSREGPGGFRVLIEIILGSSENLRDSREFGEFDRLSEVLVLVALEVISSGVLEMVLLAPPLTYI